jgi:hypothetical protein
VGASLFPNGEYKRLLAICRFSLWAFINDDIHEYDSHDSIQRIREHVIGVLEGRNTFTDSDYMTSQLNALRNELVDLTSMKWLKRFINSIDSYYIGMQAEIPFRSKMQYPSLPVYLSIRELAACVYPLVTLIELETGTVLPEHIAVHPVIREIARLTCRIMAICNDLYSAPIEDGRDVLNLVLVIRNEQKCNIEEAYKKAVDIHNQDVNTLVALWSSLTDLDLGIHTEAVTRFVESIGLMIQGHLFWLDHQTNRYTEDGHAAL